MEYILLVEDDKQLSFIAKRILVSKGYGVVTAFSIRQAKSELKKREFDLILLDMMLPDGEGSQMCEEIREYSVCPIIFVSCLSDQETKISALKQYIPTHSSSFQVLVGTDVKINDDIDKPLLSTIDKINTYLEAWNPEQELEMGLFRVPVPDFNKRAIREAIVNAFSHRDYTKMGRVRIAINDDGLTVANPGGFIEGVSIKNLLTAEPHGRNPQLADALKRIGLAERTGRGIDRIYEGSLVYGNPLPDYSNSTAVTVSLFIPRSRPDTQIAKLVANEQNRLGHPLSLNTLLVLNMLKDLPRSNVSQLAEAANLSEIATKNILDSSIEFGIVDFYGSGRGRTYILSPKVYNTKSKKIGYVRQVDIDETRYPELIINMAKTNEYISRADVIQLLHVDDNKAYRLLKSLVDQKILTPKNKGRYSKYFYSGND